MAPRLLIGLTGNIATGKSAVAQRLRELGATVINADEIAHTVVQKGQPALAEIAQAFGPQVLQANGELDRKALGQLVFNDDAKLKQLERITHPAVHVEIQRQLDALPPDSVAVIEVIKLIESGWADECDSIWVTDCPPEEQVNRLMRSRGMSEEEARSRVAAQNPQSEKLAIADVVIDTSGTYAQTRKQVAKAWDKLMADTDPPGPSAATTTAAAVAAATTLVPTPAVVLAPPAPPAKPATPPPTEATAPSGTLPGTLPGALSGALSAAQEQTHGPALGWVDWLVRLGLWGISIVAFAGQLGGPLSVGSGFMVLVFALLMGGFLLGSIAPMAQRLFGAAQRQPLELAFLPLVLLLPYWWITLQNGTFDTADLLVAGALIFMPTILATINTPALQGSDVALGLIGVAIPLLVPVIRDQPMDTTSNFLRVGAFILPVLLLLFTTRQQKQRMNFLFICAVLSLWYSVEFNAFPSFDLPAQGLNIGYFHLSSIVVFLFILAITGRFRALGLALQPSARGLSTVAANLVLFALIAIPLGLLTHFITPHFASPTAGSAIGHALAIFLFVALPEEILFRGALLTYLDETMRWPLWITVGVSSILFGAAHLNNSPNVGWYFVLATIAGVFYARTYLATRNVGAAATLHTAVDWLWALVFSG